MPRKDTHTAYLFDTTDPMLCPKCYTFAIVPLPAPLRELQPDDTTHVCLPGALGGCNHGFALDNSEVR